MALGLFVSAFARTEFQAVQFMPALRPPAAAALRAVRARATRWPPLLEAISDVLPLTYAYDALDRVANHGTLSVAGALDVVVICA